MYPPPVVTYEPTPHTPRLQLAVIVLSAAGIVASLAQLPWLDEVLNASIEQAMHDNPMAGSMREMIVAVARFSGYAGLVIGVVWNGLVILGAARRWRWMYWAYAILGSIGVLGAPMTLQRSLGPLHVLPLVLRAWVVLAMVLNLALVISMWVALSKFGPWAMRKVTAAPAPLTAAG